jgi:hypothetical protein
VSGLVDLSDYSNIKILDLSSNTISKITGLSNTIIDIDCSNNKIIKFDDNLPENLITLNCSKNLLKNLDNLPENLITLNCSHNQIKIFFSGEQVEFSVLPKNLKELYSPYPHYLKFKSIQDIDKKIKITQMIGV